MVPFSPFLMKTAASIGFPFDSTRKTAKAALSQQSPELSHLLSLLVCFVWKEKQSMIDSLRRLGLQPTRFVPVPTFETTKHPTCVWLMEEKNANGIRESVRMASTREVPVSVIDAIRVEDDLFRKMLGTGGCWFAFDVLFYGNVLFQPIVLGAAFGAAEAIQKTAMDTSIVSALSLPGYFLSVITIGH
jgi:hypothetical protein